MSAEFQFSENSFQDTFDVLVNICILQTQHVIAACFQFMRSHGVTGNLVSSRMSCSINLDDELRIQTNKIDNEASDGMLTPKFPARKPPIAKRPPEQCFCIGLTFAKLARPLDELLHTPAQDATSPL